MEFKTDALLLKAVDYGENDKMVTLLTADRGKIGASMKGVKKASAKLRFAAQPFCFAEYVLSEKSGRNTVISAALHDGFYPLREDVNKFYAAATVCEVCDKLMYEGMEGSELLIMAVSALKGICGDDISFALIQFLLNSLRLAGYPVRAEECPFCDGEVSGKMRFDMESGAFACESCAKGTPASEVTYQTIRAALGLKGERFPEGEKRALKLLYSFFTYQTDSELKSLMEYIRLI